MFKIDRKLVGLVTCFLVLGFCLGCAQKKQIVEKGDHTEVNPVIAHRGAWRLKNLPHNSMASLKEAINLKCGGTEFDVHLTGDNVLVVTHDQDFYGIDVERSTYKQLLAKKHPNGESIPTAEEYLKEGLKQNYTKLIFELKESKISQERTLKSAETAANLVKKLDKKGMVEFISFNYGALLKIKEIIPNAEVSYLGPKRKAVAPQKIKADNLTGIDYRMSEYKENDTWIKDAQKLGLSVNVWTIDKKEDMIYFLDKGVDYITTDSPDLLLEVWKAKKATKK